MKKTKLQSTSKTTYKYIGEKKTSFKWLILSTKCIWNILKIAKKGTKQTSQAKPPTKMLLKHS